MRSLTYTVLSCITLFLFTACEHAAYNQLSDCCANPPLLERFGGIGEIYMPNLFTPNSDGFNDRFTPLVNPGVNKIVSFRVFNGMGRDIFKARNFDPGVSRGFWDGKVDGIVVNGVYDYEVVVRVREDEYFEFKGKVCNYDCQQGIFFDPFVDSKQCRVGLQHDGYGGLDSSLPPWESDCQ